ncbi:pyridoxamine 5'-phosphate oxidase family protein [Streptomyces sp. NPDC059506]|uniref:pyridoxamine 5'-phosphate oxidase family protein n=1 Tax=Streptomyces sp. NPDC059506 TaxID=3347751 RepID=UPI0036B95FB2
MHGHDGSREAGRQECLRLLASVSIGRVVCTLDALPAVVPVTFQLDEDRGVLLCTSARSRLVRATDGHVVAFQADRFDEPEGTGWSVTVTGRASVVTDPEESARLRATGSHPWVPAAEQVFVRIAPELVSGRVRAPATARAS